MLATKPRGRSRERGETRHRKAKPAHGPQWSILSPQGRVLFYLAVCPDSGVKEIARALGLTERSTWGLIRMLRRRDMLRIRNNGRRHHYSVNMDAPLLLPTIHGITLRPVLEEITKEAQHEEIASCEDAS